MTKEAKKFTKEEIKEKLQTSQAWLERGILAIYSHQTHYERQVGQTCRFNNVGFNGCDAGYLSYVARWLDDGKSLSGGHVAKARKRMLKYAGQLARIANGEQELPANI